MGAADLVLPEDAKALARAYPLLLSTRNQHKIKEFSEILGEAFPVCGLGVIPGFGEVEESGDSFEANAALKAQAASVLYDGAVIADDSGLEVDALDGAPGVYSARFAGEGAKDGDNNRLLLEKLAGIPEGERTARFRCVIALAVRGKDVAFFDGSIEGKIAFSPAGKGGFGYDPLFVPAGYTQSFAELAAGVKNQMSHRGRAAEKLRAWLESRGS